MKGPMSVGESFLRGTSYPRRPAGFTGDLGIFRGVLRPTRPRRAGL